MKRLWSRPKTCGRIVKQRGYFDPFANSLYAIVIMTWFLSGGNAPVESFIECLNKQDSQYQCITPGRICISPTSVNEATYRSQRDQCKSQILTMFSLILNDFCNTRDCTGIKLSEPAATVKDNARTQYYAACTDYTYTDWSPSACPANGQQTREVTGYLPQGCAILPPAPPELTKQCTPAPSGPATYSGYYSVEGTVNRFIDKYTCSCTLTMGGNITATVDVAPDNTYTGTVAWSNGFGKLSTCGTTPVGFDACYDVYSGQTWTTNWPDIPLGGTLPMKFGFFGAGGLCGQSTLFTETTLTDSVISGTAGMTTLVADQTLCRVENGTGQFTLQRNN